MSQPPKQGNGRIQPLSGWIKWRKANPVVAGYVKGVRVTDPTSYFLRTHAVTETLLRRALLVGLRKNHIKYSDAQNWLNNNDVTPDRQRYPAAFDALYGPRSSWVIITGQSLQFAQLWDLWLTFTKVLRNHLAHGMRTYGLDWLQCGTEIDQAFIIEFCASLRPLIGGDLGADLRKLSPRLGIGRAGTDIDQLIGRNSRRPRPSLSLQSAQSSFQALGIV